MVRANALAILPEGRERAEEGEWLETMLIREVVTAPPAENRNPGD